MGLGFGFRGERRSPAVLPWLVDMAAANTASALAAEKVLRSALASRQRASHSKRFMRTGSACAGLAGA